ncbi:hypothetical protein [Roseicyclus sp.]|uniref:hypothetical protein n=1 Tax=Roseicyclus sp. TaxID=1914329 RepID=UPI001BD167F7|nr:hypothetical protein [Roseicyclus sp.]
MTVNFALFLSPEGIALAHRQDAGHWALIGEVPFAVADLAAQMAGLKAMVGARGDAEAQVLLVLPDDQILYTSFTAPTHDAGLVTDRIIAGLDGLTPYPVADLVYDWRAVEQDRIKVAVVARETLDEAKEFATAHGFVAAGFAAMPPVERYPGMPVFGDANAAVDAATTDLRFGPDLWVAPEIIPEIALATSPKAETSDAAATGADPVPPQVAESGDATGDAATKPVEPTAKTAQDPAPKPPKKPKANIDKAATLSPVAEPMPAPTPESRLVVTDGAIPAAADVAPDRSAPVPTAPEAELVAPIADQIAPKPEPKTKSAAMPEPTPPAPEAVIEADLPEQPSASAEPDQANDQPLDRDMKAEAEPEEVVALADLLDPMFDRMITPIGDAAVADDDLLSQAPNRAASVVTTEASTAQPSGPDDAPSDQATDKATAPTQPIFGFSAKRRPGAKPTKSTAAELGAATSKLMAETRSRLGFGGPSAEASKQRHPDVTLAPPRRVEPTPDRPGSAFVAQLARVRDASKSRPKPQGEPPSLAPQAEASAAAPTEVARKSTGAIAAGIKNLSAGKTTAPATSRPDAALAAGLLARKSSQPPGPSLRTGLVLTLALLILLIIIAVWSVLFLPDSPMARLFGGGNTTQTAQSDIADPPPMASVPAIPSGVAELAPTLGTISPPDALADAQASEEIALTPVAPPIAPAPAPSPVATLPGIDADLDLAPLPPMPDALLPTIAEAEALYASQQIWPRPPERPFFSPFTLTDDIYIASIDPEVSAFDAVALSDPQIDLREVLRRVPAPPAFGVRIDRDARGLVAPTAEGVLTPEGAFVILGQPEVAAIPRPREIAPAPPTPPVSLNVQDAILSTIQPRPRPINLDETRERQLLGGLSRTELAAMRPTLRPVSAQENAARASLFPQAGETATDATTPVAPVTGGTARAVTTSRVPSARPADFATTVAAATSRPTAPATVSAAAFAPAPAIPSNADVARAATSRNEIRLRDINLIGITGTSSNRSALVRLSSGRFVRVAVGDRLDGGRVAAIGTTSLQYVVNGRNITLEIPG